MIVCDDPTALFFSAFQFSFPNFGRRNTGACIEGLFPLSEFCVLHILPNRFISPIINQALIRIKS